MSIRFSADGSYLPDNHCDTADCVVPTRAASLLWVITAISMAFLRRSEKLSKTLGMLFLLLRVFHTPIITVGNILSTQAENFP